MGKILMLEAIRIISTAASLNMEQLIKITICSALVIMLLDISVIVANIEWS